MAKSPIEFLRDYVTNGVPSSGAYNPPKRDLREYLLWLEGQIGGGGGGGGADYSDDIAALDSRMTTVEREVAERTASASHRPGDAPTLFSGEVAGSADQQAAQTLGTVVVTASGATLSLPGGAQLWTRQDTDVEQGVLATAEWRIVRLVNSSDPLSDAVDLGITWLDKNKNRLGADHQVRRVAIQTFDGVVSHRISVSKGHEDADLVAPNGAVYARPYVRTYGDPSSRTGVITLALSRGGGAPGPAGSDGAPPSYEISDDGYMIRWSQPDGSVGPWLDIGSAAAEARAEADRSRDEADRSEDARDIAAGYASDAISGGMDPGISTVIGMGEITIPVGINHFHVSGYYAAGDGGGGLWKKVASGAENEGRVRSADGALWEVASEPASLLQFGAVDDGVALCRSALYAFADVFGRVGKRLRLPVQRAGVYNFGSDSSTDFTGIILDPDDGVTLRGLVYLGDGALVASRPVKIDLRSPSVTYPVDVTGAGEKKAFEKDQWVGRGDIERAQSTPINVAAQTYRYALPIGGDDMQEDTLGVADAHEVAYDLPVFDGLWRCAEVPAFGGDEINAVFPLVAVDYHRGVIIRGVNGYVIAHAQYDGGITLRTKMRGEDEATAGPIFWPGSADHLSYYPAFCLWTIRVISPTLISILLNGMEVVSNFDVNYLGHVEGVGFVVASSGGTASGTSISHWSRVRSSAFDGKGHLRIVTFGDSKTADGTDTWVKMMRNNLEYSFGSQVESLRNFAVSGHTSEQQLAVMIDNIAAVQNATDVVIAVGTNDVQSLTPVSDSMTHIGEMIDIVKAAGRRCLVVVFECWYPKSLNYFGQGEDPQYYEKGAVYRAALLALVAEKNVPHVDMQQSLPPILGHYTNPEVGARDILVRDNIHQTTLAYRIYAWAIARAMAGLIKPVATGRIPEAALPARYLRNGWLQADIQLSYCVDDIGRVSISGQLNAGTKADGTTIMVLPTNLQPKQERRVVATTDDLGATAIVVVEIDGEVKVYGMNDAAVLSIEVPPFEVSGI